MPRRPLSLAAALAALLVVVPVAVSPARAPVRAAPTGAGSTWRPAHPEIVPGEVIVRYRRGTTQADRRTIQQVAGVKQSRRVAGGSRKLEIIDGDSVTRTVRELRARRDVQYAVPNYVARAAIWNDPGRSGKPQGWVKTQWNFAGPGGINAPAAWRFSSQAGAPGGKGVIVAVADTGVAYENRGDFRRAPDLYPDRFTRGFDFIDEDGHPDDENGHGTHVTGTIAQRPNNHRGVTGLAYGVKIMPLRVLDRNGEGDSVSISRALRYAAKRGAKVINLSLEFDAGVTASQIPDVVSAINYAHSKGALLVGASGNVGEPRIAYPARANHVMSVGATTENLCQAEYSNEGQLLDIVAPGGGQDAPNADNPWDVAHCHPGERQPDIFQETYACDPDSPSCPRDYRHFGLPRGFVGTSMASPHVAAAAALVIASGRIGAHPSPDAVEARLERTARDLGPAGHDARYGAGLLNAAQAVKPAT